MRRLFMKRHFLLLPVLAITGVLMLAMTAPAATAASGHPTIHSASSEPLASAPHVPLPLCEVAKGCRVVPGSPAARGETTQVVPDTTVQGPYNIAAFDTNYYMDAEHQQIPTRVWVYPHNGSGAQIWYDACCYTETGSNGVDVTGGALFATYSGTDMCLNVSGYSWNQTTPLYAWPCSGSNNSVTENELFYYPNVGVTVSYYEICPVDPEAIAKGLCANVSDGIASEHYLILWDAAGTPDNMQFAFENAF